MEPRACKVAALVQLRDGQRDASWSDASWSDASWSDETLLPASGRFVSSTLHSRGTFGNRKHNSSSRLPVPGDDKEAMWKLGSLPVDTS